MAADVLLYKYDAFVLNEILLSTLYRVFHHYYVIVYYMLLCYWL